jgi:hypothetical protein
VMQFSGYWNDLDAECETHIDGPWNGWVRLKYEMTDYGRTNRSRLTTRPSLQPHDHGSACGGSCARA